VWPQRRVWLYSIAHNTSVQIRVFVLSHLFFCRIPHFDIEGWSQSVNRRRIDSNCKMKKDKRKTTIYKTYTLKKQGWTRGNKMLYIFSRNMIDKTMYEVLWRNISDFYVHLRVEVGKHPHVILAMYFYLGQE
jgi:hypothetical protein